MESIGWPSLIWHFLQTWWVCSMTSSRSLITTLSSTGWRIDFVVPTLLHASGRKWFTYHDPLSLTIQLVSYQSSCPPIQAIILQKTMSNIHLITQICFWYLFRHSLRSLFHVSQFSHSINNHMDSPSLSDKLGFVQRFVVHSLIWRYFTCTRTSEFHGLWPQVPKSVRAIQDRLFGT